MVKKLGCDVCNKDFNEGTGGELKIKNSVSKLYKMADVCGTCLKEKFYPQFAELPWYKWQNPTEDELKSNPKKRGKWIVTENG